MIPLCNFSIGEKSIRLLFATYQDGSPALVARDSHGNPQGSLSTNLARDGRLSEMRLAPWHFWIKVNENEDVAESALASGLFEDTGNVMYSNHAKFLVWRLLDDRLDPNVRENIVEMLATRTPAQRTVERERMRG